MAENNGNDFVGGYSKRYARDESEIRQSRPRVQEMSQFSKRNSLKYFVSFFGVIIVAFFIVGGLFINGELDPKKISVREFSEGTNLELKEDNHVKFKFEDEDHGIQVDSVELDSVEITIRSDPVKLNLKINELQEVDINDDGVADITVKLIQIVDGEATIAVRKIEQSRCIENWECDEWTDCEKGKQERGCVDLNECGGDFGMPPEKKRCLDMISVNWNDVKNRSIIENKTQLEKGKIEEMNKSENMLDEGIEGNLINKTIIGNITLDNISDNGKKIDNVTLNDSLNYQPEINNITLNDSIELNPLEINFGDF